MEIFYLNFVYGVDIGVLKKIDAQINALEKNGIKCFRSKIIDGHFYLENFKVHTYSEGGSLKEKILRKIDKYFIYKKLKKTKLYQNINVVYIRYDKSDPFFLCYLKFLKKLNKKIIIEIPSYPYDREALNSNIFLFLDKICRKKLYKYVDKIVTYSEDEKIWGIPTIKLNNGINLNSISLIKKIEHVSITFIIVAKIAFWHGIDRFLLSMANYYKNYHNKLIFLKIVGEGSQKEIDKLKNIIKNHNLKEYVKFYGSKFGEELDEIYNYCDIGIGGLAAYKQGIKTGSGLKNREYCAKGIPFIIGYEDKSFKNCKFLYRVSNDNSLVNIADILEWYNNLKMTSEEIREFAIQNLSWDIQMKKVIDNI